MTCAATSSAVAAESLRQPSHGFVSSDAKTVWESFRALVLLALALVELVRLVVGGEQPPDRVRELQASPGTPPPPDRQWVSGSRSSDIMTTEYYIRFTENGESVGFKTMSEAVAYGIAHLEVAGVMEGGQGSFILERFQTEVFWVSKGELSPTQDSTHPS